ncbi:MAG: ribulose-phosphate 3-epimerase [Pseudoramibacter alactolyticus]|mgnify:CR=1 FL=1|nr:ribulose-phosphate 3-epimerase [Pseudoramibacter alactolyticus]
MRIAREIKISNLLKEKTMDKLISISMLSADFSRLGEHLKQAEAAGADWLHVDIMDGHFVPNITMGPDQVAQLRGAVAIPFDVHLMITHPLAYIERFAKAGADTITVHVECDDDTDACLDLIEKCGVKPAVVISPETPASAVTSYLDRVCMVLVMGVHPGFGGQSYIPETTAKLAKLHEMIGGRPVRLEIDGGVNFDTLPEILTTGADTIVSGSCLFKGDIAANIGRFKTLFEQ